MKLIIAFLGTVLLVFLSAILPWGSCLQLVKGVDLALPAGFEKVLIFEDDFENGLAEWWNDIHGTPTLSTEVVHSGNYSYVTDEDFDSLAYHWFNMSIIGELEVWFYDSMHNVRFTSAVSTYWAPHYVFSAQIWYGDDYEHYYAYRLGFQMPPSLSSHPRSVGWHKVNIIHEPDRAYILLDGELLVEVDHQVSFKGLSIGDNWIFGTVSYTYYDDIKVWRYTQTAETKRVDVKLSGEFDYSCKEKIPIRLSALVRDFETLEPVSGADVIVEIYDQEGNLWISENVTEKLFGTGIYEWKSNATIQDLIELHQLEEGIYLVHVRASYQGGTITSNILEFHIDPPVEESSNFPTYYIVAIFASLAGVIGLVLRKRKSVTNSDK